MNYNAVIIGCGVIAPKHADGILKSGNNLVAVCDTDTEKAKTFADKYNTESYTDYKKMILEKRPDAVHICLPHYLHSEAALFALEQGCRVMLEKPPALNREQYKTLCDERITVCFQNRFNQTTLFVKDLIDTKKYGDVKGAMTVTSWCRKPEYYSESTWRGIKTKEGGGSLINQSIHSVDMFAFLFGKAKTVKSAMTNLGHSEIEVEDTVSAVIDFENGVRATFFASNCNVVSPPTQYTVYFENATVVFDTKRVLVATPEGYQTLLCIDSKDNEKSYWGDSHAVIIKKFYETFNGAVNPCDLESCDNTMDIVYKMYEENDK